MHRYIDASSSCRYVPRLISHADLWALAANVAIKVMGGPEIPMRFGRLDLKSAPEGLLDASGRLPEAEHGAEDLRQLFGPKGFEERDVVALSGAHTVGQCHVERSGYQGQWTEERLKFDNSYFKAGDETDSFVLMVSGGIRSLMINVYDQRFCYV